MQPPNEGVRSAFTVAQIVDLIQNTPAIVVDRGVEILDQQLNILEDISDAIQEGGSVSRQAFADIHGSCNFSTTRALDWGNTIVRPYTVLKKNATMSAKFYLGAYYASAPIERHGEEPGTYEVTGTDIILGLRDTVGEVYSVPAGYSYLQAVEDIIVQLGFTQYIIDKQSAAVLPNARVWALDENIKWINIINDLLASIGYQGIWSDWNGFFRVQPYISPILRGPEWRYVTDLSASMMTRQRDVIRDFFSVPNRWVAVQQNNVDGASPVEGAGIYTFVNNSSGPTSVDARGGRVITRWLPIDAADQASLIATAQISIDADMRLSSTINVGTFPNPLHWHFDRMLITDESMGALIDVMSTQWTYSLDGDDMTHEWTVIDGL